MLVLGCHGFKVCLLLANDVADMIGVSCLNQ